MLEHTDIDKLWMVVTPHNPHKQKKTLAKNYDRLHLVNLAIENNLKIKASDIEFGLPQPSYTIDTMVFIKERYPQHEFALIMGGDNLASFHRWKNYEQLLKDHKIYVYLRPKAEIPELGEHPQVTLCKAPLLDISSSYIREQIKQKKSIQFLVPSKVYEYLSETPIYRHLLKDI